MIGFKICDDKGFHIGLRNGFTVSVQFGRGNYCEHHHDPNWSKPNKGSSYDAETAVFSPEADCDAHPHEKERRTSTMTTRYQESQIEDVARTLKCHKPHNQYGNPGHDQQLLIGYHELLCNRFADLFATDNPPSSRCWNCGDSKEAAGAICTRPNEGHRFGDFDRAKILSACGLEETK